jgi:predicted nuclease of predicted toxin-antitoxin system
VRVLLDESVPRRLSTLISGQDVITVAEHGWSGMRNGELLELASREFDVFVTVDKNLPRQQDLSRFPILVVILDANTNRLEDLRPLVPQLTRVLSELPALAGRVEPADGVVEMPIPELQLRSAERAVSGFCE